MVSWVLLLQIIDAREGGVVCTGLSLTLSLHELCAFFVL